MRIERRNMYPFTITYYPSVSDCTYWTMGSDDCTIYNSIKSKILIDFYFRYCDDFGIRCIHQPQPIKQSDIDANPLLIFYAKDGDFSKHILKYPNAILLIENPPDELIRQALIEKPALIKYLINKRNILKRARQLLKIPFLYVIRPTI